MTDFGLGDRICEQPATHHLACPLLLMWLIWHGLDDRPRGWDHDEEMEDVEA